jgi:hypothetical protein
VEIRFHFSSGSTKWQGRGNCSHETKGRPGPQGFMRGSFSKTPFSKPSFFIFIKQTVIYAALGVI